MPYKYDVFLSHNNKDKSAVETIATLLQQKYQVRCWLDKWNLIPGEPWQEALEGALDKCKTVAVFVGPNAISPWENEEMRSALEERVKVKKRRVIPVLLPGAPNSADLRLPRFLSRLTWVDFRGGLEDEEALYRLYCGIQGVKPGLTTRSAAHEISNNQSHTQHMLEDKNTLPHRQVETFVQPVAPESRIEEGNNVSATTQRPLNALTNFDEKRIGVVGESLLSNSEIIGSFYLTRDRVVARVHQRFEPAYSTGISNAFDRLNSKKTQAGFEGYYAGTRYRPISPPITTTNHFEIHLAPINYAYVALMKDDLSEPVDKELVRMEIARAVRKVPKGFVTDDPRFNIYGYNLLGIEVCFVTQDGFTLLRRRGKNVLTGKHRWDVSMSGHPTSDDVVEDYLDLTHTIRRETRNEIGDINADPRKIIFIGFHRNVLSGDFDILCFWPIDDTAERLMHLITRKRNHKNTRIFRTTEKALEKYVWDTDNLIVELNGPAIMQALHAGNLDLSNLLPEALVCLELTLRGQKKTVLGVGIS